VPKVGAREKLYGIDDELGSNAIPVHVHHLRRKLWSIGATVESPHGTRVGYLLVEAYACIPLRFQLASASPVCAGRFFHRRSAASSASSCGSPTHADIAGRPRTQPASPISQLRLRQPDGTALLDLPQSLREAYGAAPDADFLAIRGPDGMLIAACPTRPAPSPSGWPLAAEPAGTSTCRPSGISQDYYGLAQPRQHRRPDTVWYAGQRQRMRLIHSMPRGFVFDIA